MNSDDFKQWIIIKKNYKKRSASDAVSRINRVKMFINLPETIDDSVISSLNENADFQKLSIYVRSQLRRALRLLKEYNEE